MSMGVFVRRSDSSDVKFFVKNEKSSVEIRSGDEVEKLPKLKRAEYEQCIVSLRPLTWGQSCDLQSNATTVDMSVGRKLFDADQYVRAKLRAIISEWSFTSTNPEGKEVPIEVTDEAVDSLHPVVADYLLKEYSRRFEMSDDDRKNS